HGRLDLLDLLHRRHPCDTAVATNVGGDALQRHDRRGARLLGDLRLLGIGDVHDDAALEHPGPPDVLAVPAPPAVAVRPGLSPWCSGLYHWTGRALAPTRARLSPHVLDGLG